jgi:hypothetical protein
MLTQIENLNKQIRIGDVLQVLLAQSTKLIEIVNENQREVNRLKKELELLKVHTDNATDKMANDGWDVAAERDELIEQTKSQ